MTALPKLAGFAGALALLFGGGALVGGLTNPTPPSGREVAMENDMSTTDMNMELRGLGVAENGLRLIVDHPVFQSGRERELRFRVVDTKGATVRDFDVEHTKRMHLIVVRRDLTGFQHLHPVQQSDGSWAIPLRLDAPGSYRVFADFSHDEKPSTLASDLTVGGDFQPRALPEPVRSVETDGYTVELSEANVSADEESQLRFTVLQDGRPIKVEPYLGADGHLVALRDGDLAFLHVHPTEEGQGITFDATLPTTGHYRLFLQFKADGRVHTAAFTQVVS